MEVARKFVSEFSVQFALVQDKKEKISWKQAWILLFNDMLFIAKGKKREKRRLVFAIPLHTLWIRETFHKETAVEFMTPNYPAFFCRAPSKDEEKVWFTPLQDLIDQKTKTKSDSRSFKYVFEDTSEVYEGEWRDAKVIHDQKISNIFRCTEKAHFSLQTITIMLVNLTVALWKA
jgi:hypothetical protein